MKRFWPSFRTSEITGRNQFFLLLMFAIHFIQMVCNQSLIQITKTMAVILDELTTETLEY